MIEIQGNIWSYACDGNVIVIPTNGYVKKNGELVMGAGLAKQAANKHRGLAMEWGYIVRQDGNHVHAIPYSNYNRDDTSEQWPKKSYVLASFPVKHNWWEDADIELIKRSCIELRSKFITKVGNIYLPRVGCGNGNLDWADVKPVLEEFLPENCFIVVDYRK